MVRHYHPSVVKFAEQLLSGRHISYKGDPLEDFVLINFLNRFVLKTVKVKADKKEAEAKVDKKKSKDLEEESDAGSVEMDDEEELLDDEELEEDIAFDDEDASEEGLEDDNDEELASDSNPGDSDDDVADSDGIEATDEPQDDLSDKMSDEGDEDEDDLDVLMAGSEDEEEPNSKRSKKRKGRWDNTDASFTKSDFASADDFAHLLEQSNDKNPQQARWEGRADRPNRQAKKQKHRGHPTTKKSKRSR